jgi:hypothetical protein
MARGPGQRVEDSQWNSGDRKVTIKPIRKVTDVFAQSSPARKPREDSETPTPQRRPSLDQVKDQDSQLLALVRDLSHRLQEAEARIQELQSVGHAAKEQEDVGGSSSIWNRLMFPSRRSEVFLPKDFREIPVYMLLVGIGLGVVVTKVLLGRPARA